MQYSTHIDHPEFQGRIRGVVPVIVPGWCDPTARLRRTRAGAKVGPEKEGAMVGVICSTGAWALVGIVIFFWGHWSELEREFFDNRHVNWEHLE